MASALAAASASERVSAWTQIHMLGARGMQQIKNHIYDVEILGQSQLKLPVVSAYYKNAIIAVVV
jgi:hypothetical protein